MNEQFDRQMMEKCLILAQKGKGYVSPNPLVGSIVTYKGEIIGEGYHQTFGESHAEVNAIQAVKNKDLLKESTVYVNLEPCAHFGKTPPCADLLIRHNVKKVVIGCVDSFSEVSGRGIEKLKKAGIQVLVGVLEEKCLELNKRFFLFHKEKRPYIILKWAQSEDRFLAPSAMPKGSPFWLSGEESKTLVHRWRTEEDAIMVGTTTAVMDNPALTARMWKGRNPIRIVLDRHLRISREANLFDGSVLTFVFTEKEFPSSENLHFIKIPFGEAMIPSLLSFLYKKGVQSLIIEGGKVLLESFIEAQLWDEARIFTCPKHLGSGVLAPSFSYEVHFEEGVGEDVLSIYKRTERKNKL
jgi:diaminohydroxyphosphoribosylaminopyrimidine deaminase/5-amino-6-(5-phosphoribosylamino)uracil reductase